MGARMKKRKLKMDENPRGPAIEILGDGQQLVAAGTHSSGARYQWEGGLPDSIPALSLAAVDQVWGVLTQKYPQTSSTPAAPTAPEKVWDPSETVELMTQMSEDDWQHLLACLRFMLDKV